MIVCVAKAIDATSGDDVQIMVEEKEQVAIGGWATVYRAKIVPTGQLIAIKQVKETKQYKVGPLRYVQLTEASRDGDIAWNYPARQYCPIALFCCRIGSGRRKCSAIDSIYGLSPVKLAVRYTRTR